MKKIVYLYDEITGQFLGVYAAPVSPLEPGKYLEPEMSTDIQPPMDFPEKTRHFIGGKWIYQAVPPLAEPEAEPTPNQKRRAEILDELAKIDIDSVRPARAIALAMATATEPNQFDVDKLAMQESSATALRDELAGLNE